MIESVFIRNKRNKTTYLINVQNKNKAKNRKNDPLPGILI